MYYLGKDNACTSCGKQWSKVFPNFCLCPSIQELHKNKKNNHEGQQKDFKCHLCKRTFYRLECLSKHVTNVHEGKELKCELCGEDFEESEELTTHVELMHMI